MRQMDFARIGRSDDPNEPFKGRFQALLMRPNGRLRRAARTLIIASIQGLP